MVRFQSLRAAASAGVFVVASGALASPYATTWSNYNPGSSPNSTYGDPNAALGSPTRYTGVHFGYEGAVNPFFSPFDPQDLVAISPGGSLTLAFDHDVFNRPEKPYGIDFNVFGNWFYALNGNVADFKFGAVGGSIEVSKDGINWFAVNTRVSDGFATLGYVDIFQTEQAPAGNIPTDFTKAVDPSFNPIGKTLAEIIAGYNGSGGGTGVDFASTGLDFIRFVRISNPDTNSANLYIDGIAAIPTPVTASLFIIASLIAPRRRRV
ncbi:MAG: hypothetical protein KF805_07000 [Phycisphaeraceae bacterium]|nr:hypothetical protein [Phycisphaeraceae bacterium]